MLLLAITCGCGAPERPKLAVAAASDLQFALKAAADQFGQQHPKVDVRLDFGSSGNFFAQIQQGAPFDLFLSADVAYPRQLSEQGLALGESLFVYGAGRLAVWVPAASKLDPAKALRDPSINKIAIANPRHAPYGRAAEAALHRMGIYESVQTKLVLGENISQTLQFVQSGAADVGIVALSLVTAPAVRDRGRYWEIPVDQYPRIEQAGVILKDSEAARDFREWLQSEAGKQLLKQYGFALPE